MNYKLNLFSILFLVLLLVSSVNAAVTYTDLRQTATSAPPDDWLIPWNNRIQFALNSSDVDEALATFPILVHLNGSCGETGADVTPIFDEVGADYNATAYTLDNGSTRLYFEVDYWNATAEEAFVWVMVPSVNNASDTTIHLYYDSAQDGSAFNSPSDVWNSNYVMVQHMSDETTSTVLDSTSNDNDGSKNGANNPSEIDGQIYMAQDFDGADDQITVTHTSDLDSETYTIEMWAKTTINDDDLITKWNDAGSPNRYPYAMRVAGGNVGLYCFNGSATASIVSDVSVKDGSFHYVVGVRTKGGEMNIWVDGVEKVGSDSTSGDTTSGLDVGVGARPPLSRRYTGVIDEIRFSKVHRSDSWIQASYETQRDDFNSFGSPESSGYDNEIQVTDLAFGYEVRLYNSTGSSIVNATANINETATLTLPAGYENSSFSGTFILFDASGVYEYREDFTDIYGGSIYEAVEAQASRWERLPLFDVVVFLIASLFFTILFLASKEVLWGYIAFGCWLIESLIWIFIEPISYPIALLFFGIAIIILVLALILQLEALKIGKGKELGEESMTPV